MLDIIEQEDFVAQAELKGKKLTVNLKEALADHPNVGEIRGLGLMCGVEYVKDRETREPFSDEERVVAKIHKEAIKRGLFSRVSGDTYCIAPPVVTEDNTLDEIVEILTASTQSILG